MSRRSWKRRFIFARDDKGEWLWWCHGQTLDKQNRAWRQGRAWLNGPQQTFGVAWNLFTKRCTVVLDFCDGAVGDEEFHFHLALPWLISFHFSVENAGWVTRLPGVAWKKDDYKSGIRTIGVRIFDGSIWIDGWCYPYSWSDGDRKWAIHVVDRLLGKRERTEEIIDETNVVVPLPEGDYPAKATVMLEIWKRKRWRKTVIQSVRMEYSIPIPYPGKGENSWDQEDDALYESLYRDTDLATAIEQTKATIRKYRERRGKYNWPPPDIQSLDSYVK